MKAKKEIAAVSNAERERWNATWKFTPDARVGVVTTARRFELALREKEEMILKLQETIKGILLEDDLLSEKLTLLKGDWESALERIAEESKRMDYLEANCVVSSIQPDEDNEDEDPITRRQLDLEWYSDKTLRQVIDELRSSTTN